MTAGFELVSLVLCFAYIPTDNCFAYIPTDNIFDWENI